MELIQKIVFIWPQNGYDIKMLGASIFVAIGYITIIFCLLICFDYILFPRTAAIMTGNPMNFHLGFKLRPEIMTALFFISICFVLLDLLNYVYYKPDGKIVVRDSLLWKPIHYYMDDIKEVNLNYFKGGDNKSIHVELFITFLVG